MQTAAISYRVADFLKQHPPFHTMEEADLLALVEHGRVKFHESDEYVYWQGGAHGPFVYVIEQGTVALLENERLRDIRGAGDMLGIDRFLGAEHSLYAAKTCSDVVLYALRAEDFGPLVVKYLHAGRYVASYAAVAAEYQQTERARGAHQTFVSSLVDLRPPLVCAADQPMRESAGAMAAAGLSAAAVDAGGVVTAGAILEWIADGGDAADPVRMARRDPPTLPADARVSDCVLAMAQPGVNTLAIADSLVTAADLSPAFHDHPIAILRAIPHAPDTAALRRLNQRARNLLLDQSETASAVDWLTRYADLVDTAIVKRVLRLTGADLATSCWCFYGASGRSESLTLAAPPIAVIGPADPSGISAALGECGYLSPARPESGSLEEWQHRFRAWVSDPVQSDRYGARPMFDLRPVAGPERPFEQVKAALRDAIAQEKYFVRLLAHDCLANLPPVTFFRDQVVAESGEQTGTFELDRTTLQPLVDVARVFAVAAGRLLGASSLDRLQAACSLMPDHEAIFREAAEALRVVLYLQARVGIRQGTAGSLLPPALLSGYDRQVLKTCFRSILRLLEFTAECSWMVGK